MIGDSAKNFMRLPFGWHFGLAVNRVEVVFSFAEREFAQPKRITWMIAMDGVKCDSVTGCVLLRNTASERNKQRKR